MAGQRISSGKGATVIGLLLLGAGLASGIGGGIGAGRAQTQLEVRTYQQRLQRLFERLDQQKRGYLAPADLRPPAGAAGANERAQRFLTRADRNGDNHLDRQEAEPFPWLQRLFDAIDRNDDGRISGDELRQLRGNGGSSRPEPR
jgi:Ca2+-binding EF-hand superfamily protein